MTEMIDLKSEKFTSLRIRFPNHVYENKITRCYMCRSTTTNEAIEDVENHVLGAIDPETSPCRVNPVIHLSVFHEGEILNCSAALYCRDLPFINGR